MAINEEQITTEQAEGCIALVTMTLFALFASIAVGFLFGAGYGFAAAAAISLIYYLVLRIGAKMEKRRSGE